MNRLLLITLLLISAYKSAGQKIHFTDTSNHWSEFISIYNDGQGGMLFESYHHLHNTTLDTTEYRVFNFESIYSTNLLVREDTILNKVYVRDGDTDVVLMDYNLTVGDTFSITFNNPYNLHKYAVLDLDSILINATWHKVWTFSPNLDAFFPFDNSIVIEGIGCIRHPAYMLLHSSCVECPYYYMYCFSNNGTTPPVSPGQQYLEWSSILFDNDTSCAYFPTLNLENLRHSRHGFKLFPNPAGTSVSISSENDISSIIITDITGRVVYNKKCRSRQVKIDVADWLMGVYLIKVNDSEVTRFIKD